MTIIFFFILSVVIYAITPLRYKVLAAVFIAFLMSVLAFYVTNDNQVDLIAHRTAFDTIAQGGLNAAEAYSAVDRSPLFVWMLYGLTYFGDNRLTSAVPTFIGYFILVYLLITTSRKFKVSESFQNIYLLFLIFVLPWQDYAAGIRGALAYSLCCYGVYLEFRDNNKLFGALFYIFPIFIHHASIIFLGLRLLLFIVNISRSTRIIVYAICLLSGSMIEFLGSIIESLTNITGLRIFTTIGNGYEHYIIGGTEIYEVSVVLIRVCAVLLIYYMTRRPLSTETKAESSIYSMYTMLMLIAIGFVWQYDIVCRYTVACLMLSSLIFYRFNRRYTALLIVFAVANLIRYYFSYYRHWEILFQ